ncbi:MULTISPECIES: LysM peptidoglycan-binding domain-containing protein [unclassified Arthrobacter]|uniref:LysM peptidoglycan-binding domain-containing protein n=1 Tax=unclassified Arthrobacter TaxID=235627 RepID=UPI002105959A|nr:MULTISPECIES: LysM peptidoglycan-binding domain-containing protein [unclassified Arthrobacter]MCQ1985347.1 LysM peptidoglycan-binding domain-containing protein [Arthrobacter sp. zg-Y844]MCQ1994938.1 LysM peptidoglycan-binding domain-containing protein [Arthrobacter sp. zg-Y1171]UWX81000.1 LysM peptidoglycan-binding domain-containing protein [Arthrobacter sp. zg-Y1171]
MTGSTSRPGLAADALATAAAAALGLLLLWCGTRMLPDVAVAGSVLSSPGPLSEAPLSRASLTRLAGFCAAAAGLLLTLWWILGFACALAGCLLHRFGFRTAGTRTLSLAPAPLRRLASAALGISLAAGGTLGTVPVAVATAAAVSGTPAPAFAPTGIPVGPDAAQSTPPEPDPAEAVSPLWRPSPPQPAAGGLLTGVPRPDEREVVVAAGDTLWSLAASQLGPQATDAETAALWPRWYELNREVIGPDPGLIHPGQVLAVPPP